MRAELARLAAAQHGAFSTAQALGCYSPAEIRARVKAGSWHKVFHGVLRHAATEVGPRMLVAAAGLSLGREAPACLHTAAALLGFGVLADPVTHVLVKPGPACLRRRGLWPHQLVLAERDVRRLACGLLCTTPDRTAVDLARLLPPIDVLAILDAALEAGICTPRSLEAELVRHVGLRGVLQARRWIPLASRGPDSPQESRMRFRCFEAGLPPPVLQLPAGNRFLDLGWERARVGLEYDGEVHDGAQQRRRDRRRHNLLEDQGWAMYYATDLDIYGPSDLFVRVRAAIERRSRA